VAGGWRQIEFDAASQVNVLTDVIAADGVFLVAGSAGDARESPVVLHSADGLTWQTETIASAFAAPSSLNAVGDRIVAIGAGGTAHCAHPYAMDSWARTADGTWTEAPWAEMFCSDLESGNVLDRGGQAALVGDGFGKVPLS